MEAKAREHSVRARWAAAILLLAAMMVVMGWLWPAAAWTMVGGAVIAVLAVAANVVYVIISLETGYGPAAKRSQLGWKHRHLGPSNTISHGAH